jgi:hypothetical protein
MTEQAHWHKMYLQSVEIRKSLEESIKQGLVREMKLKEQFVDLVCAIDDLRNKASSING